MHFIDAKGILTGSGGRYGMNVYRGCSHGCIYCDSRSRCYKFTHPFEDIEVKRNAPELLEKALRSKRQKCVIGTGSMSDPYMHCEEELRLTRRCLEIILKYGFGAAIQTKSDRILQDIDLLDEINQSAKCVVQMTLTTYDDALCGILEPGDPDGRMDDTDFAVHQRYRGKHNIHTERVRTCRCERCDRFWYGADAQGRRSGVLLCGA